MKPYPIDILVEFDELITKEGAILSLNYTSVWLRPSLGQLVSAVNKIKSQEAQFVVRDIQYHELKAMRVYKLDKNNES